MQQSNFRLGFDGGGTNTRAVAIDGQNQILGRGESGASNPYAVGMDAAIANLELAADAALQNAGLTRAQIRGWGLGIGGVCSPHESAAVETALRARIGNGPQIVAVEDAVATWAGAFGSAGTSGSGVAANDFANNAGDFVSKTGEFANNAGNFANEVGDSGNEAVGVLARVVCIAGTGVGCWGKNGRGATAQADGAGPLLGDRGSGYWIGERALRHATRVCDGVCDGDDVARAVLEFFGAEDLKALIRVVYAPDFERSRVAELVPVVLQHADENASRAILEEAGRELAQTSLAVLGRLSQGEIAGEVALIGGVLVHAAPVRAAFVARLREGAPRARLVEARYEPAIGAALLLDAGAR